MYRLIFVFWTISPLNCLAFLLSFFLIVFSCPFTLLRLLLVLFTLLLRLHDVVHKVVQVFIIHLFVSVVILCRLCLKLFALAFVTSTFLLAAPLPLPCYPVEVISHAIFGITSAHALSALRLSLMHLKLVAVMECLITGRSGPLSCRAHRLLVLLLSLQLLLFLHEFSTRVLV